jgi:hypothetical protein
MQLCIHEADITGASEEGCTDQLNPPPESCRSKSGECLNLALVYTGKFGQLRTFNTIKKQHPKAMRASKAATPKSAAILSIRRVKKREGKHQKFARAVRATIFTPLTPRQARYLQE